MELVPVDVSVERSTKLGAVGSSAQLSEDLFETSQMSHLLTTEAHPVESTSSSLIHHSYSCVDRNNSSLHSCSASILNVELLYVNNTRVAS